MFTLFSLLLPAMVVSGARSASEAKQVQLQPPDPNHFGPASHIGGIGQASQLGSILLHGDLATVFPLFGPGREAEWAPGWRPEMLYSPTPEGGEGAVFRTTTNHSAAEGQEMLWTVARLDAPASSPNSDSPAADKKEPRSDEARVAYVTVIPGERMTRIEVRCRQEEARSAADKQQTRCEVSYSYVALGTKGEEFLTAFRAGGHQQDFSHWEQAINHYLATGKRIDQ